MPLVGVKYGEIHEPSVQALQPPTKPIPWRCGDTKRLLEVEVNNCDNLGVARVTLLGIYVDSTVPGQLHPLRRQQVCFQSLIGGSSSFTAFNAIDYAKRLAQKRLFQ